MTDERPDKLTEKEALLEALGLPAPPPKGSGFGSGSDTELLLDYLEGKLDPDQERSLQERLLADPGLSRQLLDLEAFVQAPEPGPAGVADLPTAAAWKNFQQRLEARRSRDRGPWWLQAAAGLLLVSTLSLGGLRLVEGSPTHSVVANLQTLPLDPTLRSETEAEVLIRPGDPFRLLLPLGEICSTYQVRITGPKAPPAVEGLGRNASGYLELLVFLEPGRYQTRVSGCEPSKVLLEESFRVVDATKAAVEDKPPPP